MLSEHSDQFGHGLRNSPGHGLVLNPVVAQDRERLDVTKLACNLCGTNQHCNFGDQIEAVLETKVAMLCKLNFEHAAMIEKAVAHVVKRRKDVCRSSIRCV